MISNAQIFAVAFSAVLSAAFPLVLLFLWRKKTRAPFSAAAVGAGMFFLFAMVLEQLLHSALLRPGGYIVSHTWAYALYGALAAGVFEETGRLVGFRLLLKRRSKKECSVMYGIGHGGMESLLICTATMVTYLVLAHGLNAAGGDTGALPEAYRTMAAALQTMAVGTTLIAGIERVIAVCFHIALSVLVFEAAKRPGKLWMYPAAILLHAGLDIFAVLYQRGILTSIYAVEGLIALATLAVCLIAARIYRRDQAIEPAEKPADAQAGASGL